MLIYFWGIFMLNIGLKWIAPKVKGSVSPGCCLHKHWDTISPHTISALFHFVRASQTWLVALMVNAVSATAVTALRLVLQAPSLSSYSTHFLLDCLKLLMTFLFSTSLNSFMHQRARPMVLRSNLQYSASTALEVVSWSSVFGSQWLGIQTWGQ